MFCTPGGLSYICNLVKLGHAVPYAAQIALVRALDTQRRALTEISSRHGYDEWNNQCERLTSGSCRAEAARWPDSDRAPRKFWCDPCLAADALENPARAS